MHSVENPAVRELLADFRQQLTVKFGLRLLELKLFGSYAKGTAHEESDVDVAVVLDRIDSHAERTFPMELAGDLTLTRGFVIMPLVLSKQELEFLRKREELIAANIDRDGISV